MIERPRISVAVPLYNEEDGVTELLWRVGAVLDGLPGGPHEIVLVDDGSIDGTLRLLESAAAGAAACASAFARTEARRWIAEGRVAVNGKVVQTPDRWVDMERDRVTLDGRAVKASRKIYLLLYKPKGYLTTYKDPENRPTVYDLLKDIKEWVFPVGRLDLDTSGLLLVTNDAQFAERMTNPAYKVPKTYLVKSSTLLTEEQLQKLRDGVVLSDGPTKPAVVTRLRDSGPRTFFEITIAEGRNRQVRRMVEALGAKVLKLVRTNIGPLEIGPLQIGTHRLLTSKEVHELLAD